MRLFSRRRDGDGDVPEWASFFTRDELFAFLDSVTSYLKQRSRPFSFDPANGTVHLPEEGEQGSRLGLVNLAQTCRSAPRREWSAIIQRHLEHVFAAVAESSDGIDRLAADFDAATSLLKVRLYASDTAGRDMMVVKPVAEGIIAALVYDLPTTVVSVHKDHVAQWGQPHEELFRLGMDHVRAEEGARTETMDLGGVSQLTMIEGDSFFTASRALLMAELAETDPALGALVAVPSRHTVLYHVIRDSGVVPALKTMAILVRDLYNAGPGSLSPHVYWWREAAWWHESEFTTIPLQLQGNTLSLSPSDEFVEKVLNHLETTE
jgi:hypothetical protein